MRATAKAVTMLATGLLAAASHSAVAATETVIYSFPAKTKGYGPGPLLLTSTGNLEGTTYRGGKDSGGTFFRLHPPDAGTAAWRYVLLHRFSAPGGTFPIGPIVHRDNSYYGVDLLGGSGDGGTLYRMLPSGVEITLHAFPFNRKVGYSPQGLNGDSHGNFYGVCAEGGQYTAGNIFKYSSDGVFSVIFSYPDFSPPPFNAHPIDGHLLVEKNGDIYGVALGGSAPGLGFVYKVSHGQFTVVYSFKGEADGGNPVGPLLEDANGYLYGTAKSGGTHNQGVVYRLTKTGSEKPLYAFTGRADGSTPSSGVIADAAGNFYGAAEAGGMSNFGTVFKLAPDGTETTLHEFTGGADGSAPASPLVLGPSGMLFGATMAGGGPDNSGVIFQIAQ